MSDTIENKDRRSSTIGQFAIKACIVAVIFAACTVFATDWITDALKEALAGKTGGSQFWGRIERELDRAADPDSDLLPEKKQKLINDVRVIVARWRPFIDAARNELQKPSSAN